MMTFFIKKILSSKSNHSTIQLKYIALEILIKTAELEESSLS